MGPTKDGFMPAVQWEGIINDVGVNIVPKPKIEEPEDALVRITSSAICGSDLHVYHGFVQETGGNTIGLGHEAVGIVEEVGAAVDFFKVGDRVVIVGLAEDGTLIPKPRMIRWEPGHENQGYGLGADFGSEHGLQTEYARVPWADSSLAKIPHGLPDTEWLPVCDSFPTGWSSLTRSGFKAGDTVAVFGAGPIGLMCAYSAILRGASLVYVVDHVPSRLAMAASIGAMPINFTRGGTASQQILGLRPAGVNCSVDCVGEVALNDQLKPQTDYVLREAIKITQTDGGVGIAGAYTAMLLNNGQGTEAAREMGLSLEIKFPIAEAWFKGLRVQGGMLDIPGAVPHIVKLINNGRARPGFLFTGEYALEDAPLAYQRFEQWKEVKVQFKGKRRAGDEKALEIRNSHGSNGHTSNGGIGSNSSRSSVNYANGN